MANIVCYNWSELFDGIFENINELSKNIVSREQRLMDIAMTTFKEVHALLKCLILKPCPPNETPRIV